jgi:hypothetical protein
MKTKKSRKPRNVEHSDQQRVNELLAKAMKQPGVKTAMEVLANSSKYTKTVACYDRFFEHEGELSFSSSCHSVN